MTLPGLDVVGVGAATLDQLWLVPEFSNQESVQQALANVEMGGGPVATALCVLGWLGRKTALCDVLGDDVEATLIRQGLVKQGVSDRGLRTQNGARSAQAMVLVRQRDGARQIHYLPSSAGDLILDEGQRILIAQARLLHLNGRHEQAAREAVAVAREAGVWVSFDGGAGRYRDSLRDLVASSHLRIVSADFAQAYCRSAELGVQMKVLSESPARLVVITDGIRGSYTLLPDGTFFHQPAFPAQFLVDTTGCGDVFHGAFIHGWLEGWALPQCAEFASRIASKNATGLGGRFVCQTPTVIEGGK